MRDSSRENKLLRASVRREDLEMELSAIEREIADIRERGRPTMDILSSEDNKRIKELIPERDRLRQEVSRALSEERYQMILRYQGTDLAENLKPSPSLTDWKAGRDRERGEHTRDDLEPSRETDLERER